MKKPNSPQIAPSPMSRSRTDQDTPWKSILEHYFQDCILFFFPHAHAEIDWSRPHEFLDNELQQITRDAAIGRRYTDKLAKVWLNNGNELWILIHLEIQGKPETRFAQRMYTYHYRISDRYNRPVLSMAILCDNNPNWRPSHYNENIFGCSVDFRFPTSKLLDYQTQWQTLEQSHNPFATVVMAHLKTQTTRRNQQERKTWKLYLIRRLYEQGYQRQDVINLFIFIDWVMVLPTGLEQEVWQTIHDYEQEKQMPYVTSVERIGIEKGRQEGIQEGAQQQTLKLVLRILERRFETISATIRRRLQRLTTEQLERLIDSALGAESLPEFAASLPKTSRASQPGTKRTKTARRKPPATT